MFFGIPTALAGPFDATRPAWDSLSVFVGMARGELGPKRVLVAQELDYASLAPEDAIVLVHPVGDLDLASLSRFLHEGGRVVLLDDFGDGDLLLSHFGMRRRPLGEPSQTLGNRPHLPIATPSSYHPTVVDVDHVVLNHASCIDHPDLSSVLEVETRSGEKKAVAVAGAVGKGRLLAVADSSVFVDGMLRFPGHEPHHEAATRGPIEPHGATSAATAAVGSGSRAIACGALTPSTASALRSTCAVAASKAMRARARAGSSTRKRSAA